MKSSTEAKGGGSSAICAPSIVRDEGNPEAVKQPYPATESAAGTTSANFTVSAN
jgi:hypothetical protein